MVTVKSRIVRGSWSDAEIETSTWPGPTSNPSKPKLFDAICRCPDMSGLRCLFLHREMPLSPCSIPGTFIVIWLCHHSIAPLKKRPQTSLSSISKMTDRRFFFPNYRPVGSGVSLTGG